jgi:hypothetical protein
MRYLLAVIPFLVAVVCYVISIGSTCLWAYAVVSGKMKDTSGFAFAFSLYAVYFVIGSAALALGLWLISKPEP